MNERIPYPNESGPFCTMGWAMAMAMADPTILGPAHEMPVYQSPITCVHFVSDGGESAGELLQSHTARERESRRRSVSAPEKT